MIGWIGLGLLMLAYLILITKWSRFFIPIDAVASFLLTIHASMIGDIVFVKIVLYIFQVFPQLVWHLN